MHEHLPFRTSAAGMKYRSVGDGEPVLLIHGSVFTDTYEPLMKEAALSSCRKIAYRRRGYADSAPHAGPSSIADAARDALDLLEELNLKTVQVVGHSFGAIIALQMAMLAPRAVHSLVLLEPPLMTVPSAPSLFAGVEKALEKYRAGEVAAAIGDFLDSVTDPNWRTEMPRMLPGAIEQAIEDAAALFEIELPALDAWSFDTRKAREIFQPALYVIGSESSAFFKDGKELCEAWMPHAEDLVVKGASHNLHIQDANCAAQIARGIAAFFGHHPIRVAANFRV